MRVMFWSEHFEPLIGGVQRSATLTLDILAARGHEFVIITPRHYASWAEEELWHGMPLYRFDFSTALAKGDMAAWIRQQKRLVEIVDSFKPQIQHTFSIGPSTMATLQLLKRRPLPFIVNLVGTELDLEPSHAPEGAIAKSLLAATWVTTVSQAMMEQSVRYVPGTKTHISVLYNGFPPPKLEPAPLATPPVLLLMGRLVPQKGVDFAIAAFEKIYQRFPDVRLVIAGDGTDRDMLQEMARPMGDRVEFIGWVQPEDSGKIFNQATIVLLPSRSEGLPNVAIEASYMARPIVGYNIPGVNEVVLDGKSGLLVEPGNVEALAEAIAHLLENPGKAASMGQAAREWAFSRFTLERCADEYEALYQRVVEL